jgi:release factor glutamine methyltransferase
MVSNPPYIPSAEIAELQPEVKDYEPHLALDGGNDGLDAIRYLISTAPSYLITGGYWVVELMIGQAPIVANMLTEMKCYSHIQIHGDRAGTERFVSAIYKPIKI